MPNGTPLRRYGPITTSLGALGSMYPCLQMVIGCRSLRPELNPDEFKPTPEQLQAMDSAYFTAVRNVELAVSDARAELPPDALKILDEYLRFAASPNARASTVEAIRDQIAHAQICRDKLRLFARSERSSSG